MKHDGKLIPHGIIVISEKIPAVNWNDIFFLLVKSALKTQSMIHILDLQELREYVGHSKSANQFDHYLMQRFEVMVKRKQAFIKTKFVKRPDE